MGITQSKAVYVEECGVNYDCPVCRLKGKPPNLLGRFYSINDSQYKCNCCYYIFDKSMIPLPLNKENLNKLANK